MFFYRTLKVVNVGENMIKKFGIKLFNWLLGILPRFKNFWFSDWFDPKKSYLTLPAFWGPFIIISLLAFVAFLKVTVDEGLKFDITGDLTEWYKWFQVPIWILSLLIPVIGLCNANHKSEQARESIRITGDQNRFANYYKHAEEFSKHCKVIEDQYKDAKLNIASRKLHAALYPDGKTKDLRANTDLIKRHEVQLAAINHVTLAFIGKATAAKTVELDDAKIVRSGLTVLFKDLSSFLSVENALVKAIAKIENIGIFGFSEIDVDALNKVYGFYIVLQKIIQFDPEIENILLPEFRKFFEQVIEMQRIGIKRSFPNG